MTDLDRLLAEAEAIPFQGWDFTTLGTRLVLEPPPWALEDMVAERAASAESMLDMGTGGGEWLSSLPARAKATVATESWPPNVGVAGARLRALGVPLVQDEGATDNHRQTVENPKGRLAFRAGAFDLIANRHESFVAAEVARVLRPGGHFITQQAHSGSEQFHRLLGLTAPPREEFELALAVEQLQTAGLTVEEAEEGTATTVFADVGALAWYLQSVPWAVPGFSIRKYRQSLARLHPGPIRVPSTRFWLRARK